jgi:macrolide transport system ATP-binding/permease protein
MNGLVRDAIRGLRAWRRTPGSALLVILALGMSAGAMVALASVFNALFWRDLPLYRPSELIGVLSIDRSMSAGGTVGTPVSLFASLERAQQTMSGFAGFVDFDSIVVVNNTAQRVAMEGVTRSYFDTIGVQAEFGQSVSAQDVDRASPVGMVSFRCWKSRFGADPNVIGRTFSVGGELVTVIGVAPPTFAGLEVGTPSDIWVPASLVPRLSKQPPELIFFDALVGRLMPGVTQSQAEHEIQSLWPPARQTAAEIVGSLLPQVRNNQLSLEPRIEPAAKGFSTYREFYQRPLLLLFLLSALTIGLSCANLSSLLLARWSAREVDLAVQAALGASRGRLASQIVADSLVVSAIAVALSAPVALWSARSLTLLLWNQPDEPPLDLSFDYRVFGVMALLVVVAALSVSFLPAYRVWARKLTLDQRTRGSAGDGGSRWGHWLAAAQVALSIPLLAMACVVAVHLHRLENVNIGFRAKDVTVASLIGQNQASTSSNSETYLRKLSEALRLGPGVSAVAFSWREPVSGIGNRSRRLVADSEGHLSANPFVQVISPGYFDALGVPLLAGRDFAWTDDRVRQEVAIISAGLARTLFPDAVALGRHVRIAGRELEVIGIVADLRIAEPREKFQQFLFTPLLQQPAQFLELQSPEVLLRSALPLRVIEAAARRATLALGRDDIYNVHTLQHTVEASLLRERLMRMGGLYCACLTVVLVFVGLQAVLNVSISRRIPEIGVRIALGASPTDIRMMVGRELGNTMATGLLVGVPFALSANRLMTTLGANDSPELLTLAAVLTVMLVVSSAAALVPLRRASHVAPSDALRSQ